MNQELCYHIFIFISVRKNISSFLGQSESLIGTFVNMSQPKAWNDYNVYINIEYILRLEDILDIFKGRKIGVSIKLSGGAQVIKKTELTQA